jgi:hypothetical protein
MSWKDEVEDIASDIERDLKFMKPDFDIDGCELMRADGLEAYLRDIMSRLYALAKEADQ